MTQTPISTYQSAKSAYPSNAQIWHAGKNADGDFDPDTLDQIYFGNTPAPRGHFILNAFNRDRDNASGLSGLTATRDVDSTRPNSVASFAGRVFYAGTKSKETGSNIYFSQVVTDIANAARCYQEQDPTAEDFNQLLDTDGGVIRINDVGNIFKLATIGAGLAVIADNGIWFISGTDTGFTASSYSVTKISNLGAISKTSILEAEGGIFYVRNNGILVIRPTEFSVAVSYLTEGKISSFIADIGVTDLLYMTAVFDNIEKKIIWLYNDSSSYNNANTWRFRYTKALVYHTQLDCFFPPYDIQELASNTPYIVGALSTPTFSSGVRTEIVTVGGANVTVGGVDVTTAVGFVADTSIKVKLATFVQSGANSTLTFSEFNNLNFLDWESEDTVGKDAPSYIITGDETIGDLSRWKQGKIITHMQFTGTGFETEVGGEIVPTNDSSCLMSARWDFATTSGSNKIGQQQQIYRPRLYIPLDSNDPYDYGQSLVSRITKIKGRGRALALRFDSEAGKDFRLVGWGTAYTAKGGM